MKIRVKQENLDNLKQRGIYRIFNVETNKSYVGSTWKSFRSRWKQHLSKLNTNKHHSHEMQNAFNKYGSDSFVCEILEIIEDENILLEKEAYYINKYDAYKNGYRVFQGTHYRDYTREYGEIVKLVSLESNLLVVFEHGIGLLEVN